MNTARSEASQAPRKTRVDTSATRHHAGAPRKATAHASHNPTPSTHSSRPSTDWRSWEDDILTRNYHSEGGARTMHILSEQGSHRTLRAIYGRVRLLGIRGDTGHRPAQPRANTWTDEDKTILKREYRAGITAVQQALTEAGRPPRTKSAIHYRAAEEGLTGRSKRPRQLTPEQATMLTRLHQAHKADIAFDAEDEHADERTLRVLRRKHLAKHLSDGLWTLTCGGLLAVENQT